MTLPLLQLQDLSKTYGRIHALRDVQLELQPGPVGLLGPNGAGKTTLLKLLLGLLRPTSGHAKLFGHDPRSASGRREIRRRVGYMPESDASLPGQNAVETVATLGRISGLDARSAIARAHESLDYVGLDEIRYRPASDYSTGGKQRLKLATALVHDPDLLLLDEPTNGLDPRGRREMLDLIRHLGGTLGKNLIVCSHLLPDVEATCDSVVLLHGGTVLASESIQSLTGSKGGGERLVEIRGDLSAFERSLEVDGMTAARTSRPDELRVTLAEEATSADRIFQAASACGVVVVSVRIERTSLEDAFVERVQEARREALPQGDATS